jgi:diguanylate cyclase (GGDEF)-like protein
MGDILGLALITPFLIAWSQKISLKAEPRSRLETFALFSLTLVAGQIVFLDLFKDVFNNYLDNHLMFLFMAFVAIRFSPRVVTLALLLTSIQALIGAYHHLGYFAKEIESANLGNFWVYMMIQTIDTMAISINIFSRAQLASVLKKNQDYTTAVLNSMPNEIIVLDHAGLIVSANQSWLHGSDKTNAEHLDDYLNAEIGQNYLAVLARGQGISPDDLDNAHGGIRGVLDGRIPYFNMEYAFQSPIEMRWFAMSVAPFKYDWVGAVITHTDITERKQLEDQVHQIAFRDPLTQLYNRRALNDHLSQAMAASKRSACCCALMFLDVDNFKPLNDEHGHGFGDLLLIELANRLKSCVREVDTVARFGGDEFVVLLSELHLNREASAALARSVAEKIQASLATPYLLAFDNPTDSSAVPISYQCSVSIGVVVFLGHEHNQNNILKLADVAMYQAKVAGRNLIRFYQS